MAVSLTVGVALCTFDGARFVDDQLASILRQSTGPDLIVVADDGSSDATMAIVNDQLCRARDLGIRVIVLPAAGRLGVGANFSRAIAACDTDLVILSDQDDLWVEDRVATVVAAFSRESTLELRFEDAYLIDDRAASLAGTLFEWLSVTPGELDDVAEGRALTRLLRRNLATGATVAFRRRLFDVAAPFPSGWLHDEWLALVAAAVGGVGVSRARTVAYRLHGTNVVGVSKPTLRYRFRRMLRTPPWRNRDLAVRWEAAAERLPAVSSDAAVLAAVRAKAHFERARASMPSRRLGRILPILRLARRGGYDSFASQGRLDMLRDLLRADLTVRFHPNP